MAITLYGVGPSRSFRCLWALHEAGIEHEYIQMDIGGTGPGGAKGAEYMDLNPQGKVPTLQHDDFVLTESAAILYYINNLADGRFIPTGARERAKYDELSFYVLAELEQPLWTTGKHRFAIPEAQRVPDIFETAHWEFAKAVNALGKLVEIREFAFGDQFTFADILLAHTFNWADKFEFDVPAKYLEFRDHMFARDAAQAALAANKT